MVWIGDYAAEHKLAPAWQPLLAWLDELAMALGSITLDIQPEGGAALQAAAQAALDTRTGGAGQVGFTAAGADPGGLGLPMGLRGLAERAVGQQVLAEILAVFPVLLPATAEQAQGAPNAMPCAAVMGERHDCTCK